MIAVSWRFDTFLVSTTLVFHVGMGLENMIRECHGPYCYHLHNTSESMIFIWNKFQWLKLPQLQAFCQENVSPSSWLLELYDDEEQTFLENFVRRHPPPQRSVAPPIVPLNLQVSFMDGWTWLGSQTKLVETKSVIFGRNLKSLNGSHFAFLKISNVSFFCDQSPSFVALYRAICEIKIEHCGQLTRALHAEGYCFYIVEDLMNWHQAREFCRSKNGDLATFQGETKIIFFLLNFASSLTNLVGYWIGLTNIQEVWLKRNESAVYANWGSVDVSSINYSVELAYLSLERRHWFPILPATFQMRIVCVTDNDRIYQIQSQKFEKETCHASIWLGVFLALTSMALVVLVTMFTLERRRNAKRFDQDHQVIFDKTGDSTDPPYDNFPGASSNPAVQNEY